MQPAAIRKIGNKELRLDWPDGHESSYPFRYLRQSCQCAMCVDEWSGKPLLARESVDPKLEGLKASVVGQYALQITFSDGHATGLYTFDFLRKICPCSDCVSKAAPPAEDKRFLEKQDLRSRK